MLDPILLHHFPLYVCLVHTFYRSHVQLISFHAFQPLRGVEKFKIQNNNHKKNSLALATPLYILILLGSYVSLVPSLTSKHRVDCYPYMPSHILSIAFCSNQLKDSRVHASARQKSDLCRVLLGRRSLNKINWPAPCFLLFLSRDGARVQRVGKHDDQVEATQKI